MAPQPLYEPEPKLGGRAKVLVPLVAVALLAAAGGAYALSRGGDDDPGTASSTTEIGTGAVEADGNGDRLSAAPEADMVQIPAGTYTLGSDKPEPNQAETLTLTKDIAAFYIDKYEVTNADYAAFVNQKDAAAPLSWPGGRFPETEANRPVQGVSYDWASAYCTALGKRLPTEAEWEAAARGADARPFPWGADPAAGGLPDHGTYDRGTVATNVSQAGVFDLTGNAWEWVSDSYDSKVDPAMHILRGGQNGYLRKSSVRLPVGEQSNGLAVAGFRCAADTVDPALPALQFGGFDVPEEGNVVTPTTLPPNVLYHDQFDDATSGWIEKATERNRFGYHPNGFFHLETKTANVDVEVQSPYSVPVDEPVSVAASAFVDPNNTANDAGTFSYGLLFRDSISSDGNALIFIVDPRSKKWLICNRDPNSLPDASKWLLIDAKSRQIPDTVSLEVRMLDDDRYEFLIDGASVATHTLPGYTGTSAGMVLISYAGSEKAHIHFDEFQVKKLS